MGGRRIPARSRTKGMTAASSHTLICGMGYNVMTQLAIQDAELYAFYQESVKKEKALGESSAKPSGMRPAASVAGMDIFTTYQRLQENEHTMSHMVKSYSHGDGLAGLEERHPFDA